MTIVVPHTHDPQLLIHHAQHYAERGWHVIPLHGVSEEWKCTCGDPNCQNPGKHPRIKGWQNQATTDPQQIRQWFIQWPDSNIGIVTGRTSGIVVVDVDGHTTLNLPPTARVKTRRGYHHYYRYPPGVEEIRTTIKVIKAPDGVDIKADGGYVVAPPSRYPGGMYLWEGELELALFPPELLQLVERPRGGIPFEEGRRRIPEGVRNDTLTSLAGFLRQRGDFDEEDISKILHQHNEKYCDPPLPPEEVDKIARGIQRYPTEVPLTDVGNAKRLVYRHGRDIRYVPESKRWFVWDGRRWKEDTGTEVATRAKSTVRTILAEASAEKDSLKREAILKWYKSSQSRRHIEDMIELAASEPEVVAHIKDFDRNPWLLNLENCTLDLHTMEFREHRREDMITKLSPVRYDHQARAPRWEQFLEEVLPNQEVRAFVQRAVGYTLTGDTSAQVLFMLVGTGANGKTTFLETIRYVLGEYAAHAEFQTFTDMRRNGGPRNDLARLRGARLVTTTEPPISAWFDESLIKSLTGGEPVTARYLFKEYFEYTPEFKVWITANNPPGVREFSEAMRRRILVIEFPVTIPPERRNPHLLGELKQEAPGILNWALEGLKAWREQGLNPPEAVQLATNDYFEDTEALDDIGRFIDSYCDFSDPEAFTSTEELHKRYCEYARPNSFPVSLKTFAARAKPILLRRGARAVRQFDPDGRKLRGYQGVKVKKGELRSPVKFPFQW